MNRPFSFSNKNGCCFFLLTVFCFASSCFAQDKNAMFPAKLTAADFTIQSPLIDSNANAIVMFDKGKISFEGNAKGWFTYVYKRSTRIKIINKKGLGLSTVELLLYKNDESKEKVENVSGITYNLENEKLIETKLGSKEIYDEQYDKNHYFKKFSMPAVKEGSIIEYNYTIKSDFLFNLPSWEFQSADCPTLFTEYNVTIPGMLSYMSIFQGFHNFSIDKSGEGFENYTLRIFKPIGGSYTGDKEEVLSVSTPTSIHRWVMNNLPAFNVENYISSPVNFIDKISFQLYQTYDGEKNHDVSNNWAKASEELLKREDFGKTLHDENGWMDNALQDLLNGEKDSIIIARKIYKYVQDNFTCTNTNDKFIKTDLPDVFRKKSGTVGDINLLLTAMLVHKNIPAVPVLLSTRSAGRIPQNYPMLDRLNYVVCKININATDYFLDATTSFLPFGKLPAKCYNGHARVIATDTAAVYFEPDSLKEKSVINVLIINNAKQEVEGGFTQNQGFYQSLQTKDEIAKSGIAFFEKNLKADYPEEMPISNIITENYKNIDEPVSIKFDFKLNNFNSADIIYFNPMLGESLKKNPFYAAERIYPVEMPYTVDEMYVLNMENPTGYKIDELPKSAKIKLNDDEGMYEYLISSNGSSIQMRRRLLLNKANFLKEDYKTLREFYGFIVNKEAEQIVFKKIK